MIEDDKKGFECNLTGIFSLKQIKFESFAIMANYGLFVGITRIRDIIL